MNKIICVYSSSSCAIDRVYFDAGEELGKEIGKRGDTLLFGGGMTGLMGASAKAVHSNGGRVIGIIPRALNVKGVVYESCDELIVTEGMRERKAQMDNKSHGFIALPGGYGTLEELLEIITLKQLRYHNKPIVILNVDGFYDKLIEQFQHIIDWKFAKKECKELYYVTQSVVDAVDYIHRYVPYEFCDKWMTDIESSR